MSKELDSANKQQAAKTPLEDLRKSALEHYREASSKLCHWNSFVENAIMAYNPPETSHQPKGPLSVNMDEVRRWPKDIAADFISKEVYYCANCGQPTSLHQYPDFKCPQPREDKPEWEILKLKSKQGAISFWSNNRGYTIDELDKDGWDIYQVRRLSDNEIFTLGDLNEYPTGRTDIIKEFKISEIKPLTYSTNMMVFRTDTIWSNLSLAKKSKPKEELKEPERGCGICGGKMVFIRGRYPGMDKREVCPTCNTERLEQINEISSKSYGQASQEVKYKPIQP